MTPSWLLSLPPLREPSLDPRLVRLASTNPADLEQFLNDLLAWGAGQRTLVSVATGHLADGNFVLAAQCIAAIPLTEPHADLLSQLEARWQRELRDLRIQVEEIHEGANRLGLAGCEPSLVKGIVDLTDEASQTLTALTMPAVEKPLLDLLQEMVKDPIQSIREICDLGQMELDEGYQAIKQRQEREKQRLILCKKRADDTLDDILLSSTPAVASQQDHAMEIHHRILEAFRARNLQEAESLSSRLGRLCQGEQLEPLELPSMVQSGWRPAPHAPSASAIESSPFSVERLSDLVKRDLERASPANASPGAIGEYPPREWEPKILQEFYEDAKTKAKEKKTAALGPYLDSLAKLRLLRREPHQAMAIFSDLLRWTYHSGGDERLRDSAAWGLVLSLALPYLPENELKNVLTPKNLKALCKRRIGTFPLSRLDQLNLMGELAHLTLNLGTPYARHFTRQYLLPFLSSQPPDAYGFVEGLVAEASTHLTVALDVLALVFEELSPERNLGARLAKLCVEAAGGRDQVSTRRILMQCRDELWQHVDELDLAQIGVDALEALEEHTVGAAVSAGPQVDNRLLTTDVELQPESRLILQVTCPESGVPLHGLRTQVSLFAKDGKSSASKSSGGHIQDAFWQPPPLPRLLPGQRQEIIIPFRRLDEELTSASRLEISHTFAAEGGIQQSVKARLEGFAIRLHRPLMSAPPWPDNPYIVGRPIQAVDHIYGRQEELSKICHTLIGQHQDNAVLILGDRRFGKTTLLNKLQEEPRIRERYHVLRIDLQNVAPDESATRFYRTRLISRLLQHMQEVGMNVRPPSEEAFEANPHEEFKQFMERVDRVCQEKKQRLLLIMDEFEQLFEVIEKRQGAAGLSMEIIATLRSTIQTTRRISLVLAGVTDVLRRHTGLPGDRLFKFAVEIPLKTLTEQEAKRLIEEPVKKQYELTASAVERIITETNRQPYIIQQICFNLYQHMSKRRSGIATAADVEEVIRDHIIPHASVFSHLKDPVQSPPTWVVIKGLAALQLGRSYVSLSDLQRQLRRNGTDLSETELLSRLHGIRERTQTVIDHAVGRRNHFRLIVGLFARHLRYLQEDHYNFVISP